MDQPHRSYEELLAAVQDLAFTEEEAVTLYSTLASRFGWAGSPFTTEDIRYCLESDLEDYDDPESAAIKAREDAIIAFVKADRRWQQSLSEYSSERGFEILTDIVTEAIDLTAPSSA